MNENIDWTEILKDCPIGWKLYTPLLGEVEFRGIQNENEAFPIRINEGNSRFKVRILEFTKEGYYFKGKGECILFPSKEQRDWSKLTAHWYKKERFDPKMLKQFDKVLVRDSDGYPWKCALYSHTSNSSICKYINTDILHSYCIPYNDDTKHLIGTTEEAPEYYRYWDD